MTNPTEQAAATLAALRDRGLTLGTCESLTGGLLAATLTDVPGASSVFRGALVTYASDLKTALVGVPAELVAEHGVINEATARQMAVGARGRLGVAVAVACTGVAGPDPQDGEQPGTVWLAVAGPGDDAVTAQRLTLSGTRAEVRLDTVVSALKLVASRLEDWPCG